MMAERVTPETARKAASNFLNNNGAKSAQLTDLSKAAGFPNLYIFTAEQGFVVMAADDCVQPILGYSLDGHFATDDMPDNLRGWLQGYNDEIQWVIDKQMKATSETTKLWKDLLSGDAKAATATVVVDPLIQTKWNQNGGYYNSTYVTLFNNLCPNVSGTIDGKAAVGCVATAMAQIMKFWEYPKQGNGSNSYTWNSQTLSADFSSTTYDWANMPNTLSNTSTTDQINAVATLMYHCGVSVNMSYGASSSASTSNVMYALYNYFGYANTMNYKSKGNDETWTSQLKAELDAGRPLQYRGSTGNGGGHSFVCDGYDSRDYFHFNWGWAGSLDGYFTVSNLNTGANTQTGAGNGDYTDNQAAIFGIQPNFNNPYAPANLQATLMEGAGIRNVNLSWDAATNASSYKVYRNNTPIATVSSSVLAYTDVHIPYGTNTYHVRSVDANGNLSNPSNSETVAITFPAPTNLTAQLSGTAIALAWAGTERAVSYNVYCNEALVANVSGVAYTHSNAPYGNLSYYVKGIDELGDESEESNTACFNYDGPIVSNLTASLSGNDIIISWIGRTSSNATLTYGSQSPTNSRQGLSHWAHRFLASDIAQHTNKYVEKVSFYPSETGNYTCHVFKGTDYRVSEGEDVCIPTTLLASASVNVTQTYQWIDITFSDFAAIDGANDLWIVMQYNDHASGKYPAKFCTAEDASNDGNYWGRWTYSDGKRGYVHSTAAISWLIKTYVTDGTYTYNLYDGTTQLASGLTETTYTHAPPAQTAAHQYTVTTNYYGGVSAASNMAGLTLGTASLSSLKLGENDKMTVTEGSQLTVSGTMSNDNADNLIIENGAQLIHNSEGVKATVKKEIAKYTVQGDDENLSNGWYLLASPMTESIEASTVNGLLTNDYDLYYFDQSQELEWRNYESTPQPFSTLDHKTGYLYANSGNTTLSFAGTLAATATATPLAYDANATTLKGFNLIGNPFACNATVERDFYVMNESMNEVTLAGSGRQIAPCEGIFVQAKGENESVSFTKATASAKGTHPKDCFDVVVTQGRSAIDRTRVRLGEGIGMEKFSLDNNHTQISLWQDGQQLAVACANGENEMPLNFKAAKNGTYTLAFEVEKLDLDYLHLIDNMTGNEVDVLAMPTYTFAAKTTDYASRFRLVFSNCEDAIGDNDEDAPFAYVSNGEIRLLVETCQGASLQVVDMTGRVIRNCADVARNVSTSEMSPGVHVLRLIDGDNVRTQKIVIE